ncbi:unnamed protein product [Arctia plantaginis]|uniref:Uncharacterized protein n=1 Tax=Arctia plantaginis TaxID=874455 RepID=A0A8S1BSM0_ARCPL|nr:unnamed protein product [Arctia plantaginis]
MPVDKVIKRTCAATGISKRTLMKIKNEAKVVRQNDSPVPSTSSVSDSGPTPIPKLSTPGKKRRSSAKKIELDNFDLCALRNIVNSFYTVRKEVPTLKKILAAAKKDLNFRDHLQEIAEREFIISLGGEESSPESEIDDDESDTMSGVEEINYSSEND